MDKGEKRVGRKKKKHTIPNGWRQAKSVNELRVACLHLRMWCKWKGHRCHNKHSGRRENRRMEETLQSSCRTLECRLAYLHRDIQHAAV